MTKEHSPVEFLRRIVSECAWTDTDKPYQLKWRCDRAVEVANQALAALSPVEGLGCRCSRWYSMACAPMNGTAILIRRQTEFESEEGYHVVRWDDGAWQVHDGKFDYALRGDEPQGWQHLPALSEATTDTGDRGRHLAKDALPRGETHPFALASDSLALSLIQALADERNDPDEWLGGGSLLEFWRSEARRCLVSYPEATSPDTASKTGVKPEAAASLGANHDNGAQRFPCSTCDTSGRCTFACSDARSDQPPATGGGEWIPWSGGECPVPEGSWGHVKLRDGSGTGRASDISTWWWGRHGNGIETPGEIIAYRLAPQDTASEAE